MILKGRNSYQTLHSTQTAGASAGADLGNEPSPLSRPKAAKRLLRAAFLEMADALCAADGHRSWGKDGPGSAESMGSLQTTAKGLGLQAPEAGSPRSERGHSKGQLQAISASLDLLFPGAEASPAPADAAPQAELDLPKGEIEAALDAAFPEDNAPPVMSPISCEEIASILDKVLPEDPVDGASGSGRAPKPFVVPYDFELRCLMNSKGEPVSTDWIPTGFIRTLPRKSERN